MKLTSINIKFALAIGAITILAIFITRPLFAQDTAKKESHKKIVMKIVSDDNGKTTIIDTTMEFPDTTMIDSVRKEVDRVFVMEKDGKHARIKIHKMPEGFNYDFDIPELPDCHMNLGGLDGMEMEGNDVSRDMEEYYWQSRIPGPAERMMRPGDGRQTLNDILGDIPMDRVVSYSIKDRKNGKRIIIDLNDAPMFEHRDRVIVIREPARMHRNRPNTERRVKVYVNPDEDVKLEKATETPAPPPPPPPASQPDKKAVKKTKI